MTERALFGFWAPLLLLAGPALHTQAGLDRVQQSLSQGRFVEAAKELQQIVLQSGPALKKPAPAEEKMLRGAIDSTRRFLNEDHPPAERNAARQVLCLSRAYFPEDLPGLEENALKVGAGTQRPELIGEPVRRYPPEARKAGMQGTVIVEAIIDQEGCARRSRVLKGVPSLDGAALAAVQSWTFQPATRDGKIVAVYYVLSVAFSLNAVGL
ncbi:MAG: energy transducer TonB [Acidobacteria bacterium]|nr:energy transducer TonB [Acidobacteriota bacterium]